IESDVRRGGRAGDLRWNGSATPTSSIPTALTVASAQAGPWASRIPPATGPAHAPPIVRNVPCSPMASPRAAAGTLRFTALTVDDIAGASSSPEGSSAGSSHHHSPPASPIGAVSTHTAPIIASGGNPRGSPPYTKPPTSEYPHQTAIT